MFKLYRDSIFKPKNIIHYRAKKTWFVILYVLLASIPYILACLTIPMQFNGVDYQVKTDLNKAFTQVNAKIENGSYKAGSSFEVDIDGYEVLFLAETDTYSSLVKQYSLTPDFVVQGENITYVVRTYFNTFTFNVVTINKLLGDSYLNKNLVMETSDQFYLDLDAAFTSYKPLIFVVFGIEGMLSAIISMLMYALIGYIFLNLSIRANHYMKKGQLFKMMIFSSTAIIVAQSISLMFDLSNILSFILLFIGFIPFYRLEREFIIRIRMQEFGSQVMNNPTIMDKINELLNNKKDDDNDSEE